jgi:hypothetical protein
MPKITCKKLKNLPQESMQEYCKIKTLEWWGKSKIENEKWSWDHEIHNIDLFILKNNVQMTHLYKQV